MSLKWFISTVPSYWERSAFEPDVLPVTAVVSFRSPQPKNMQVWCFSFNNNIPKWPQIPESKCTSLYASDLLVPSLVKTFQPCTQLQQFKVNSITLLQQLHTCTTHYPRLVTLTMIYTPGWSIGGQESPTVYQVCICKPFLLLQPSVEVYIVSLKALIPA